MGYDITNPIAAMIEGCLERVLARHGAGPATPLWLTPAQVRKLASCGMQRVTDALNSGELPATKAKPVRGSIGGRLTHTWRIKDADARAWAERVEQERHLVSDLARLA